MEKKVYRKPRISSVKLNVQQTILATCKGDTNTPGQATQGICYIGVTYCEPVYAS
jgi:hypothetical protein